MNHKLLLDTAVLAGEIMLCSGAETYRVEDTMYHILKTSKAESIEALALMTGIMATINSPDMEQPMTVIKAVNNRTTNLNHVIQVNDISRRYCGGELTLEETYQALRKIGGMQYNRTLCNAALVGVAAGFAMMFGGSFLDVAATAVVGVLLAAIITLGEKVKMNVIIIDILSSIGIAILAIAMKTYGMKEINMDTVIISAIMPLVPGVAITNAIRDTLQGGLSFRRGSCFGGLFKSGIDSPWSGNRYGVIWSSCGKEFLMIVRVLGAFIAIFTFAVLQETPKKYLGCAGIVGAVGWLAYLLSEHAGADTVLATFISAMTITLISHTFARIFKAPVTVFLIAGILPTVPGAGMYRIVYYIIQGDRAMSSYYLTNTLELAGVIAIAIFIMDTLFRLFQKGWKQNSLKYSIKMNEKKK